MTKVMVTIRADDEPPTLDEVVERYQLGPDDIDTDFGIVEVDPDDRLHVVLVSEAAAARIQPGDGWVTEGPFANPRIEPFGPPEAEEQ